MTPNEYQRAALRTEFTPDFVRGRFRTDPQVGTNNDEPLWADKHWLIDALETTLSGALEEERRKARLMHGMMGICTETGELQDMVKKNLIYGKPFDRVNVIEEVGDIYWYCALALDAVGATVEEAMERNIAKLKARFPDKFTSEAALNRDLDAERTALEALPVSAFVTTINRLVAQWRAGGLTRNAFRHAVIEACDAERDAILTDEHAQLEEQRDIDQAKSMR